MRSALSLPAEIIRRRAAALIELSGKANRAAISRRNGVCGVTAPGAGIWMLHIVGVVVQNIFGGPESVAACSRLHRRSTSASMRIVFPFNPAIV
jgi:hypothetical protein